MKKSTPKPKSKIRNDTAINIKDEGLTSKDKKIEQKNGPLTNRPQDPKVAQLTPDANEYAAYAKQIADSLETKDPLELLENRKLDKRREGILEPEQFIVCNGKRGTGKTFTLDWINYSWWKAHPPFGIFPIVMVCTETRMNYFWQQRVPQQLIHTGMPATALKNLIDVQTDLLTMLAEDKFNGGNLYKIINPWVLVILDDTITADGFKYNHWLAEFAAMGRHLKIAVHIATQYPKAVSTLVRENVDWVQVHFIKTQNAKAGIIEDYLGIFSPKKGENEKIGHAVMAELTSLKEGEDHAGSFWIDNRIQSNDPVQSLFKMDLDKPEKYQLGVPEIWEDDPAKLDDPFIRRYPPTFKNDLFENLEMGSVSFFESIRHKMHDAMNRSRF